MTNQSDIDALASEQDATIAAFGRALELRDHATKGHSQRVMTMTVQLARLLDVAEAELVHVRRGALLHDVGKIGIPDAILLKPGPLTDDEWAIMRRHPVYAYELLSPVAHLRLALDIPYCHHEKWDGSGYPRGLKGDAIPLAARAFAIVDMWDALRSKRPYKRAWARARTMKEIKTQRGIAFDPTVVDVFVREMRTGALWS